ncbi:hypothetical protein I3843_12G083700 [Carya illinoinensis]|uniref:Uncharacterized protein n=1 Tax=Carya illinoinensis TaxID=32201 RepID=A0A922IWX8_CARIL|nr:hypothetical protein I3842_12G082900 [Carya illinoinensis]KAG7952917.1 hypothetical protein I3843_12G083700 [Carya illinoinensis]
MAKLVFAVTVSFFLFSLCHARISSDPIQNDAIVEEPKTVFFTFPQHDTKTTTRTTVLLPSEKHGSELPTMVEFKPKKTDPKLPGSDAKESETDSVHLTMVSFRPINRHFPRHSFPVTFHRGHHFRRHHHHHHHHIHELKPRFHGRDVPYGDDMILSDEKYSSSNRPLPRGGVRQIPVRWAKFGHEGPRFHHGHDDVEGREHMKKKKKRHHRSVEREEMEGQHDHEGGFMNKFRQFLMQF